mgnify:CR=1 FL=1
MFLFWYQVTGDIELFLSSHMASLEMSSSYQIKSFYGIAFDFDGKGFDFWQSDNTYLSYE